MGYLVAVKTEDINLMGDFSLCDTESQRSHGIHPGIGHMRCDHVLCDNAHYE